MSGRNREFQADLEPLTAQIAAEYHNSHGGSSFSVKDGSQVRRGYAVGGAGVPEVTLPSARITAEQYQAHRDNVRALNPDPHLAVGTWVENGKSVLDASTVVSTKRKARSLQKQRGERAVFDVTHGKELDLR